MTKLREVLASFVAAGRRSGSRPSSARRGSRAASQPSAGADRTADIRECARSNGYAVSHQGRVATNIVEAFNMARCPHRLPPAEARRRG